MGAPSHIFYFDVSVSPQSLEVWPELGASMEYAPARRMVRPLRQTINLRFVRLDSDEIVAPVATYGRRGRLRHGLVRPGSLLNERV